METLRAYLKTLSPTEQADFAARCGTTIGYLRKALSVKNRLGETLVVALERESAGAVPVAALLPEFSLMLKQSGYHKSDTPNQPKAEA